MELYFLSINKGIEPLKRESTPRRSGMRNGGISPLKAFGKGGSREVQVHPSFENEGARGWCYLSKNIGNSDRKPWFSIVIHFDIYTFYLFKLRCRAVEHRKQSKHAKEVSFKKDEHR
jgi:hypothetical protein